MTDPFKDMERFMTAFGQNTRGESPEQVALYTNLIREEDQELWRAINDLFWYLNHSTANDDGADNETLVRRCAQVADGVIDGIVVRLGLLLSMGIRPDAAWCEVHRSNMSKLPADGKPRYREDGKVLKPETFVPPDLVKIVTNSWGVKA